MNPPVGETHDPALRSWVESANDPRTDFPIQNLPLGLFQRTRAARPSVGVAIGDRILDLRRCADAGLLDALPPDIVRATAAASLNPLMALGQEALAPLRGRLSELLRAGRHKDRGARRIVEALLVPMDRAVMRVPAEIGDYTDFYASVFHATRVGKLFRPDNPLLPNYKYVPIGYHGRASSLVASGAAIRRPLGQWKDPTAEAPVFGLARSLDYELEVGFFVGTGNRLGESIPIENAESHLFGLCLVNDWSARDLQAWEYQPLGPFLAKSFATTISPWVVTMAALAPFRSPAFRRPKGDPEPLPYLTSVDQRQWGGIDLTLEVYFSSAAMRTSGLAPVRLSRSNFRDLYWTIGQLLTHHASNGCNLRTGDLLASGTVSGPGDGERGCLLELTRRGADPLRLPSGEERRFLEDGDEVILRGYCEREGFARIGFGECRGTIVPAQAAAHKD